MTMNHVYEICPYCDKEVKLKAELKKQKCPKCHEIINPCALCDMDKVNCKNCPLGKEVKK